MSAMEAIRLARESGIRLGVSGQNLTLDAARKPPAQVVDSIRRHKADIVALLTPRAVGGWDATDYRAFYNERAGIAEHDGGLCQEHAERRACEETVCQWLALNPPAVSDLANRIAVASHAVTKAGGIVLVQAFDEFVD